VVGLEAGEYGFPANVSDDPVMGLVLSEEEPFSYAEERRLFYVAMTRAKRRVYLVTSQDNASPFIQDDLLNSTFQAWVEQIGEISERHQCPKCRGNTIRRRDGQYGALWACSHFPLCDGKLDSCPWCSAGGMVARRIDERVRTYKCTDCGQDAQSCPVCNRGYLREKTGKNGPFLGCSRWRKDGTGCRFTRNIPAAANA
jgi:DNA helicase-4